MTTTLENNLLAYVAGECAEINREDRFDAMLDDCYSFEKVGGPFAYMSPSSVLKECDPVAYRCGVNDYADGEEWVEIDGCYYDHDEVEKARDEFVSNLEDEATELEEEIEELEGEDDPNLPAIASATRKLADLRADIKAAERYTF